jgi:hypothetical protein
MRILAGGRQRPIFVTAGFLFLLIEGCEGDRRVVAIEEQPPIIVANEAGAPEGGLLCATSACPPGRVTCADNPFPCGVDLSSDDDNCGACGHHCPALPSVNAVTRCIDGECTLGCTTRHMDCNGIAEDGCEADVTNDDKNCGICGRVCPEGQACMGGECKCANPLSCGACGNVCPPDTEPPFPDEWNMERRCVDGKCHVPTCNSFYGDCNSDMGAPDGDGCETDVSGDPKNCGACGNECAPGSICQVTDSGPKCICPCGASCFDLNDNIDNCGACGFVCPGDARSVRQSTSNGDPDPAHGKPVCTSGICDYRCSPNWADCDKNIDNGCETDLRRDPYNCGACGIRCDGVEGQACIDGQCAMQECGTSTQ